MQYKCLIEANEQNRKEVFTNKVKRFLNKRECYFKIYLNDEVFHSPESLVGYAFRCSKIELYLDLKRWASEEVDGMADFTIIEKQYLGEEIVKTYIHETGEVISSIHNKMVIISKEVF